MKAKALGLVAALTLGCSPDVETNDYTCLNQNCTQLGNQLTGTQRPRIFLTETYHPGSDDVSYALKWRDTTTTMARMDSANANLAIITYLTKTGGKSQMKWDLSQYSGVRDFTLIIEAPGYKDKRIDWHIPPKANLTRLASR